MRHNFRTCSKEPIGKRRLSCNTWHLPVDKRRNSRMQRSSKCCTRTRMRLRWRSRRRAVVPPR